MYNNYATRLSSVPDDADGYLSNGSAGSKATSEMSTLYQW